MVDRSELANDPELMLRQGFQAQQARLWTTFPGIIQSVDWSKLTCVVQPAIQAEIEDEESNTSFVNLPLLLDCPIQFLACATFLITVPLAANDEVLVHIASRCIDAWWERGGVQAPAEFRMHDLSDGFVSPGIFSKPKVPTGLSSTNLELRSADGTTKIAVKPSGEIDLTAASVIVNGNMTVNGNLSATGSMSGPGGIGLTTHKHVGVQTGSGTSGTPTP